MRALATQRSEALPPWAPEAGQGGGGPGGQSPSVGVLGRGDRASQGRKGHRAWSGSQTSPPASHRWITAAKRVATMALIGSRSLSWRLRADGFRRTAAARRYRWMRRRAISARRSAGEGGSWKGWGWSQSSPSGDSTAAVTPAAGKSTWDSELRRNKTRAPRVRPQSDPVRLSGARWRSGALGAGLGMSIAGG